MMGVFVQVNEGERYGDAKPIGYVIEENGCWSWVGATHRGYGRWQGSPGEGSRAHRVMYIRAKGPIPKGLQLDHLCRNRKCVNPDHLEPVTNRINVLRGRSPRILIHVSGICSRGHSDWYRPNKRGHLSCRQCARDYYRAKVVKEEQ